MTDNIKVHLYKDGIFNSIDEISSTELNNMEQLSEDDIKAFNVLSGDDNASFYAYFSDIHNGETKSIEWAYCVEKEKVLAMDTEKRIKTKLYVWGEYFEDEEISQEEFYQMEEIGAILDDICNVLESDKDKTFYTHPDFIDTDIEGTAIKYMWAIVTPGDTNDL